MPKKSIAEPVFDASRNRWRVNVPASLAPDGKRVRSWHPSRQAARKYIDGLVAKEAPSAVIPPALAMKADEARAILEPWNRDLVQGARELAAALEVLGDTGTLFEAAKQFRDRQEARSASSPLGEAVSAYLDSRSDLRPSTLASYNYTLQKLLAPLHGRILAEITSGDLGSLLATARPTARAMHQRNIGTFWRWAAKPPRNWADPAVVGELEKPRLANDADIKILQPAEVRALMTAAEAEGPAAAAAYAVAVFGGVRMAELARLTWGDVRDGHIEIGRAVAKKHSRRLVPVCATLEAWLDATRPARDDRQQAIVPPNWDEISKNVRRRAGWAVEARRLAEPPQPTRGPWPANACRHTCASVQVAIGTPLEDLVFKFGHSGGHDLLRRHYVARLTRKDALAILAVGPGGSTLPGIKAA